MGKQFQLVNILWWILIPGAFTVIFLLAYYPSIIHLVGSGDAVSLVSRYRMLLVVVFWSTVVAHAYETILAWRVCQKFKIDQGSTVLWILQTFILGFFSFNYLDNIKIHRYFSF